MTTGSLSAGDDPRRPLSDVRHIEKGCEGKQTRSWVTLTTAGSTALAEEFGHLKTLIARVETTMEDQWP